MNKEDLEFILYIILGTLTGITGMVAALFIAYLVGYKGLWRIFIGFLIGIIIYTFLIGPNLTSLGNLVYTFIQGIIAIVITYIVHKDRFVMEPIDLTLKNKKWIKLLFGLYIRIIQNINMY